MDRLWDPLLLSLRVALTATVLTAVVAIPLAFVLTRRRFFGQSLIEALITVPLVLPPTVVGFGLILLFGSEGWVGGWLSRQFDYSILFRVEAAVLAAATVALPMIYLPTKAAFVSVQRDFEDAARVMGASRFQLLWHVSLPMARKGVASGFVLAFARAMGEFGATMMVFGWQQKRVTLSVLVYADYSSGDLANAAVAAAVLVGTSLVLIGVYNRSALAVQE